MHCMVLVYTISPQSALGQSVQLSAEQGTIRDARAKEIKFWHKQAVLEWRFSIHSEHLTGAKQVEAQTNVKTAT